MNQAPETLHVVFGRSIADTLRQALVRLGRGGRVIGLPDSLSVGPIGPPDPGLRRAWAGTVLGAGARLTDARDGEATDGERAWAEATAAGPAPVFWACLSSPSEHACFLAFAARMRDRPFDLVDATNLDFTTADGLRPPPSLGMMRVQDILDSGLPGRRRPVPEEECRRASEAWRHLQDEDAPFRIVRDGRLISAPLTHYDGLLTGLAGREWEVAARLIGRAMTTFLDAPGDAVGDDVLFGRLLALAGAGAVEISGPGPGMRHYQVRSSRPPAPTS